MTSMQCTICGLDWRGNEFDQWEGVKISQSFEIKKTFTKFKHCHCTTTLLNAQKRGMMIGTKQYLPDWEHQMILPQKRQCVIVHAWLPSSWTKLEGVLEEDQRIQSWLMCSNTFVTGSKIRQKVKYSPTTKGNVVKAATKIVKEEIREMNYSK